MNRMEAILACNALSRECEKHRECKDCPVRLENNQDYDCLIDYIVENYWDRKMFTSLANDEISKILTEEKCKNEQQSFTSGDSLSPVETKPIDRDIFIRPNDRIKHPSHYFKGGMECIDVIRAVTSDLSGTEAYYVGNIIKYIWRYKHKNGLEDLRKAEHYLKWLMEKVEKNETR